MADQFDSAQLNAILGTSSAKAPVAPVSAPAPTAGQFDSPQLNSLLGSAPTKTTAPAETFDSPQLANILGTTAPAPAKTAPQNVQVPEVPDNTALGIAKNTVAGIADELPQTTQSIKNIVKDPLSLQADYHKALPTFLDTMINAGKNEIQNAADFISSFTSKNRPTSEKVGTGLKVLTGAAGVVFSPLSGLFSAGEDIPVLGTASKAINTAFTFLGEGATHATNQIVDAIPDKVMSPETKANIKPALDEISALAAQILVGGPMFNKASGAFSALVGKYGPEDAHTIMQKAEDVATQRAHEYLGNPATIEQAHQNMLKIQMQNHPDLTGGSDAVSKQANNAYALLQKNGIPTGAKAGVVDRTPQAPVEVPKQLEAQNAPVEAPISETANLPTEIPKAPAEAVPATIPVPIRPIGHLEGINPENPTKLTPEQAHPLAQNAADLHHEQVHVPAMKADKPIVIGADDLKDHFGKDYNDNNHPVYSRGAFLQYEKALKVNPDPTVVLTGGGPASGKTELITKGLVNDGFKGTVYDSNMANYDGVSKQIDMAKEAGKHVEVYGVIPNLESARKFSIQRENNIGRGISDATFARGHAGFPAVAIRLLEEGKIHPNDMHILDTRNTNTWEEALQKVKEQDYVKDPLATLKKLGYNEDELKQTYGKSKFNTKTGERLNEVSVRGGLGKASTRSGTDKGNANGGANEKALGGNEQVFKKGDKVVDDEGNKLTVTAGNVPGEDYPIALKDQNEGYVRVKGKGDKQDYLYYTNRLSPDVGTKPALPKKTTGYNHGGSSEWHTSVEKYVDYYIDSHANLSERGLRGFIDSNPSSFSTKDIVDRFKEINTPSQKESVARAVKEGPKSIKDIAKETKILEPNVRRILGVGAKDGTFARVDKGVYKLSVNGQALAYIETGNAVDVLPRLAKEGFKSDMVFLDIPYNTPAIKGGNRGVNYETISVADFGKLLDSVKDIARTDNTPVIHMYSNAKSGMTAMTKYNDMFLEKGFKPVGKGEYQKTYASGKPVGFPTSKGFMITEPEGILVFTKSGELDKNLENLNFKLVRPSGYQTEKPAEMLKKMIEMTTNEGDVVLDPFAGSGVTGAEAVKSGRKAYLVEKNADVAEKVTKPRVQSAVPKNQKGLPEELKIKINGKNGTKIVNVKPTAFGEIATHKVFSHLTEDGKKSTVTDFKTGLSLGVTSRFKNGERAIADVAEQLLSKAKSPAELKKAFEKGHDRNDVINGEKKSAIPKVQNWRTEYDKLTDSFKKEDMLEAIANTKSTDKELSDILDKVEALGTAVSSKSSGVAWEIAHNPAASKATADRASALHEKILDSFSPVKPEKVKKTINERGLMIVHNLGEAKLNMANRLGGLPHPSMAVIDPHLTPFESYGDITLIADKSLIEGQKTHLADAYTQRFPSTHSSISWENYGKLTKDMQPYYDKIGKDTRKIQEDDTNMMRNIENNPAVVLKFLEENNIKPSPEGQHYFHQQIEKAGLTDEFNSFLDKMYEKYDLKENLFNGYTNSGKRRYLPLTLENASKIMSKQKDENFNYGLGSFRSKVAPIKRNSSAVAKEAHRLMTKEDFDKVKTSHEDEMMSLRDKLEQYAVNKESNPFSETDRQLETIGGVLSGEKGAMTWFNAKFPNAPKDIVNEMMKFRDKLSDMPTEYFETKFNRPVKISEFKTALVPEEASPKTIQSLKDHGLKVITYKKGEKGKAMQELSGESNLFAKTSTSRKAPPSDVVGTLHKELVDAYKKAGPSESAPEFHKADEVLSDIWRELDIAKAGERVFVPKEDSSGYDIHAVRSTFPQWLPEGLRSKELFDKVINNLQLDTLKYPEGPRARQRDVYNELLKELDTRLGVDTSIIRNKILQSYGDKTEAEVAKENSGSNAGGERPTGIPESKGTKKSIPNKQGGFVAPGKVAEDIAEKAKQVQKFLDDTHQKIDISENVGNDLFKIDKNTQADYEEAIKTLKDLPGKPADYEAITHYIDDKTVQLTPLQKGIYEQFVVPIQEARTTIFNKLVESKYPVTSEDYTPRFVKDKGNVIDRLVTSAKEDRVSLSRGGKLSKTGPMMKHRVMRALEDENGNRTVVAIKKGRVTEIKNGNRTDLGPLAQRVTPKVKEFYDPEVRVKLDTLANKLGITHERHATGRTAGLGGKRAGVSFQGENLIKTRLSPDSVLAHELGHQIDHKYGMQDFMKEERYDREHRLQVQNEMRDLADQRFAGEDTTPNFQKYVRKGSEKMAVMFEAYISNKELFKEVAPHVYNDFSDFLNSHEELKPFLDIKGSVRLNSQTHGGDFTRGKKGDTFIDKNGKTWKVTDATIKEIEKNTNLVYHKHSMVNEMVSYLKLRQLERAADFITAFKESPQFKEIAVENGQEVPANWKPTDMPQFIGYNFEPRTAEILNDFNGQMKEPGGMMMLMGPLNKFLRNAIFNNPMIHVPNLTVHAVVNRGFIKLLMPSAYKRGLEAFNKAFYATMTRNDDFVQALRAGAPMMSGENDSRAMGKALFEQMAKEMEADPTIAKKVSDALGYGNPVNLVKLIYKFSKDVTWHTNDILMLQGIYEEMATKGYTMERAIEETTKHIPDYRLPGRIFDMPLTAIAGEKVGGTAARGLAKTMGDSGLFMFGRYHYGALKSYGEMIHDLVGKGSTMKERGEVIDKLVMLALVGLVIYPALLDPLARKITGNPLAKFRRAGATTFPYNTARVAQGLESIPQYIQSVFTPSPLLKTGPELLNNIDMFTGKPIYGVGGSGLASFLENQIAPLNQANSVLSGGKTGVGLASSFIGITSPKNSDASSAIKKMVYEEKPALSLQVKKLIAEGNNTQANALGYEYNQRLRQNIVDALKAKGMPTDDATVEPYFKQSAYHMPGVKAMMNFASKPTTKTNDTVIGMALTYAHAIGVDPITAFNRIFTGQTIKKVTNGTVIVQRMSLAESQSKKSELGDPTGMTLDHVIPLELGGSNGVDNLKLVPQAEASRADKVENYLGDQLNSGKITKTEAQKLIVDFKNGKITEAEIYGSNK